ncbi:gas vesicle protein [Sinomonas sp. P47F7]|uniref:gas vesicle protein n=1 Tax=Sinomonas sp. P47F7 TaxID=3410987 RepID=UPI003BF52AC8
MDPVREPESSVSALVDTLLTKGVYLDVDAVITVAEIPLVGVSLRAALAGMETLLEYGMMRDWDEATRAAHRPHAADDGGAAHPGAAAPTMGRARLESQALFREQRSYGEVWRSGTARWEPARGFTWFGEGDRRPAVRIAADEITGVRELGLLAVDAADSPAPGQRRVLALATERWEVAIAVDRGDEWEAALRQGGAA